MIDGEQDIQVYQISDFSLSLEYSMEMLEKGYHVDTLIFKKEQPKKITLSEEKTPVEEIPLLGLI